MTAARRSVVALEICVYVAGALAGFIIVWQVIALALAITFGPSVRGVPVPVHHLRVGLGLAIVVATASLLASTRLRLQRRDWWLPLQWGLALAVLGLSYRFIPVVLLLLLAASHASRSLRRAVSWWIFAVIVAVCALPIDVTLRRANGMKGPRVVTAMNCEAATRQVLEMNRTNQAVCVADGPSLYLEPRMLIVW